MLNTTNNNSRATNNVIVECAFKDQHPSFKISVVDVKLSQMPEDYSNGKNFRLININNGEFEAVVHYGIANMIKASKKYEIWFKYRQFDQRYIDLLLVNEIDENEEK